MRASGSGAAKAQLQFIRHESTRLNNGRVHIFMLLPLRFGSNIEYFSH